MPTQPDPEVQNLKRSLDLVAYARSRGYDMRRADCTQNISVLEHRELPDLVAIARDNEGQFAFASLRHPPYKPRGADEPAADAAARLMQCIGKSIETGNTIDFVRRYERLERGPNQTQPTFDQIKAHLCALDQAERALGRSGPAWTAPAERTAPTPSAPPPAREGEPLPARQPSGREEERAPDTVPATRPPPLRRARPELPPPQVPAVAARGSARESLSRGR